MLLVAFVQWWYGPGWRDSANRLSARLSDTYLTFSVPILLRTLFAPWRRIVTIPGGSIGERARAALDNLISRIIGLIVRLLALLTACILLSLTGVIGGIILLLWVFIPLAGPVLIVAGLL